MASAAKDDDVEQARTASPQKQSWQSRLPDWVQAGLTWRSIRMLIRTWVVCWVSFLILLPGPSLRALGQAAFFGAIVSFMLPDNLPTMLYLLAAFMLVFGACLGWAWAAAGLAAGLRVRDQVQTAAQLQRVREGAAQAANPTLYYQEQIFRGQFLDTHTSAVVGTFFVVGCYAMGWLQAVRPQLKIAAIFATILLDINSAYGPLFPTGRYTFGELLFYPLGCAIGIGVACQLLIFPESFAFGWQLNLVKMLELNSKLLRAQHSALERIAADVGASKVVEKELTPVVRKMQAGLVLLLDAMNGQLHFLHLDVSFGHFTPNDLAAIFESSRSTMIRLFGIDTFMHMAAQASESVEMPSEKKDVTLADTHLFLHLRQNLTDSETKHDVHMSKIIKLLHTATLAPLRAAEDSYDAMSSWIDAAAHHSGKYDHGAWVGRLEATLDALNSTMQAFMDKDRLALLEPYKHMFIEDAHGGNILAGEARDKFRNSARPLYVCFVFAANLVNTLQSLKETHELVLKTAKKRPRRRLRVPTLGITKVLKAINKRSSGTVSDARPEQQSPVTGEQYVNDVDSALSQETATQDGDSVSYDEEKKQSRERGSKPTVQKPPKRKDPDALPPANLLHHVGSFISASYTAFWSPEGAYALRYAIVSFALWIPSVIPSSSYFVYIHRSIWALIMAQTGLALSSGELIFSMVTRLLGTLGGLVLGMLFWYMSCGDAARGNAYGLAAVTAVGFIPLVWLRLYGPPYLLMFTIMLGVTTVLALGYSWIDTHLSPLANSGKGVDIAWRRALLVLVGMAAAIIVTIFPRPPSTRRNVRLGFARSTEQIAKLYSSIIECWIEVEESEGESASMEAEEARREEIIARIRPRYLATTAILSMLQRDIGLSMFDLSFRGPWPKAKYEALLDVHTRLMQSVAQMLGSLLHLDATWRQKMLYTTAVLDPLTISDTSVTLSLLSNALHTGSPLPHAFTPLLETTLHHASMSRAIERSLATQTGKADVDILTLDMLQDVAFMQHASGVIGHLTFMRQLDRFRNIVFELVGEHSLPGFDTIKSRFDERMVKAHMD